MSKRGFSERPKLTFILTSDVYLGRIGNTQHIVVYFFFKIFLLSYKRRFRGILSKDLSRTEEYIEALCCRLLVLKWFGCKYFLGCLGCCRDFFW